MPLRGTIRYVGGPRAVARELRAVVKEELQGVIAYWHRKMLKRHFKVGAVQRYRYRRRTEKYQRRKLRLKGHQEPLVWSGETRRMTIRQIRVSGTSKSARGTMSAPRYFWMTGAGQPNKPAELTAVTRDEVLELAQVLDQRVTKRLNNLKTRETRRIS